MLCVVSWAVSVLVEKLDGMKEFSLIRSEARSVQTVMWLNVCCIFFLLEFSLGSLAYNIVDHHRLWMHIDFVYVMLVIWELSVFCLYV